MTSLLLFTLLAADPAPWEVLSEHQGITIYTRVHPVTSVREMKAQGIIEAPPLEVWRVLRDYQNYPRDMPFTVAAQVLSREPGDKVIYFYSKVSVPLASGRDYIIRLVDESDWRDGAGFLKVSWTAANDRDHLVPVSGGVVRVRINDGFWRLEPRASGSKTYAVYYIYTSAGGSLPPFIVNQANAVAVPSVFAAIRRLVVK